MTEGNHEADAAVAVEKETCFACGAEMNPEDVRIVGWPFGAASDCACRSCFETRALPVTGVQFASGVGTMTLQTIRERALLERNPDRKPGEPRYRDSGWDRTLVGMTGERMSMRVWLDAHRMENADPGAWARRALLSMIGIFCARHESGEFAAIFGESVAAALDRVAPAPRYRLDGVDEEEFPPLPCVDEWDLGCGDPFAGAPPDAEARLDALLRSVGLDRAALVVAGEGWRERLSRFFTAQRA